MRYQTLLISLCAAAPVLWLTGCQREMTSYRPAPQERILFTAARESDLLPGGPVPQTQIKNPYEGNVYAISEGKRLFSYYHCAGCHGAMGGGGIGPPLMDPVWIYGGEPDNIYDTITKGRPNGMPSWGGRIPEYQIWELVSYVRSLSNQALKPRM